MQISTPKNKTVSIDVSNFKTQLINAFLFKNEISVQKIEHPINELISAFLSQKVSLVITEPSLFRNIKEEYNARPNDKITLNDVAPIHLISKDSVAFLNAELDEKIPIPQFRSNIVVSGTTAFEEEDWKYIKIGNCEFEVITKTQRCSLLTININNAEKHKNQEPLRTLPKLKKDKKANFGIYLVPRKLGEIFVDDEVEVIR